MKTLVLVTLVYGTLASSALAQGTIVFESYPTRPGLFFPANGVFTLEGNVLGYELLAWEDIAQIRGPGVAHSDQEAPVLFELNLIYCDPPLLPDYIGGCFYEGTLTLSDDQMSELISGQWYVKSVASLNTTFYSEGQIVLVPEPNRSIWIVAMVVFVCTLSMARRHLHTRGHMITPTNKEIHATTFPCYRADTCRRLHHLSSCRDQRPNHHTVKQTNFDQWASDLLQRSIGNASTSCLDFVARLPNSLGVIFGRQRRNTQSSRHPGYSWD